jgi:hypothetical protein
MLELDMRRVFRLSPILIALFAGCTNIAGNTSTTCSPISATEIEPTSDWQGTVFTIVLENTSASSIVGNKTDAPYINSLIAQGALAANYSDALVHPSEPNYIWMAAGENFGVLDDGPPTAHHLSSRSHIADQIEAQGLTWKSYQESMGAPCGLKDKYPYEPKHNPFVFFDDVNGWDGKAFHPEIRCNEHVVDYSELDKDIAAGTVPRYAFITPNMIHDMHDAPTKTGDTWLSHEVPKIMASDAFKNGGVIFLTWDEGGGIPQADDPTMIVISPNVKRGYVSKTPFDSSSYLATVQKILGLETLPCNPEADTVEAMDELFTVPLMRVAPISTQATVATGSGGAGS